MEALEKLIDRIQDRRLRKLVRELIKKPLSLRGWREGLPLEESPAGRTIHHCYRGGFVDHLLATSSLAIALCDVVEEVYGGKVDRDLVLAGIILHDLYKPATYAEVEGAYELSPLGERLDHLSLAIGELYKRGAPVELIHVVAAHHGGAGPISPRTLEALIVHLTDLIDSTFDSKVLDAARAIARECKVELKRPITTKEALQVILAKQVEGRNGALKALRRLGLHES